MAYTNRIIGIAIFILIPTNVYFAVGNVRFLTKQISIRELKY